MYPLVFHNGRILPITEVRLSPGQAGVINGWGIFSTVRVYEGIPFALERHWHRLAKDARIIQLPIETSFESLRAGLMEVLQANRAGDACVRIYFIYNTVGIWKSREAFPTTDLIMYVVDVPQRIGPTKLAIRENGRHAAHPLTGTKVTSWLNNAWMVEQAHQRGFDDVLLLNERGEVAECTAANLYCVQAGKIFTPPLSCGCLPGVSRDILLEISGELGFAVTERVLRLEDFRGADEVFITSTTRQVQPISHLEDHVVPHAPGPVTAKLALGFDNYVKSYVGRTAAAIAK